MSQRFQQKVDEVVDWLQEILKGTFLTGHLPVAFDSLTNAKTIAHAKAMLPLCDLIATKWRQARLAPDAATNPSLVSPAADTAFLLAASALPALSQTFPTKAILNPENWAPGEQARLLAPLAAVLDFTTHPHGLATLRSDPASRPAFNLVIDDREKLGFSLIMWAVHDAIYRARQVEEALNAELASLAADVGPAKSDEAAWVAVRVLASEPRLEDGDMWLCVSAFNNIFSCMRMVKSETTMIDTLLFDGGDIIRPEVTQNAIRNSLELGKLFNRVAAAVTATPAELRQFKGESETLVISQLTQDAAENMFSKGLIAARAVVGKADVQASYAGMARVAREMALAAPSSKIYEALIWLFSSMLCLTHPPKSWAGEAREVVPPFTIMDALSETTTGFNVLMSRMDALSNAGASYYSMMFLVALYYVSTGDFVSFGQTTESFLSYDNKHTYYLRYARADAAAYTTVLQAVRAALVGAVNVAQPDYLQAVLAPIFLPRAPLNLAAEVSPEQAAVAVDSAIDLMKFAQGQTRAKMKPKHGVSVGAMMAWVCTSAFADACVMVRVACAAPSTNAAEGEAKRHLERALAAATFKYLHFVAKESECMERVFICEELAVAEPPANSKQAVESWEGVIAQAVHVIAARVADQDKTLAPALSGADAEGLQVFSEIAASVGVTGEAAERVAALAAAAAAGVDPQNEATAAKARARILAALDCGYLGCAEVRVQGVGATKKCTGCRCVRYCCAEDQRADWKTHRAACRAIKAEGGV